MKKIVLLVMTLATVLGLTACGCKHEAWIAADCVNPKTCAGCGETEGAPLGHNWNAASCEAPKTCTICALTEGAPLGHNWTEATCEQPKTCQNCRITEGESLGHDWMDPTTEAPKTCAACGKTEGMKIATDPRFTTASCQPLFGRWKAEITKFTSASDIQGIRMDIYMEFFNDGSLKMKMELKDPEAYLETMIQAAMEAYYIIMAEEGYSRDQAAKMFQEENGKDIEAFYRELYTSVDLNQMFGLMDAVSYVYFVEGDQLYQGLTWSMEMTPAKFQILDGNLYLFDFDKPGTPVIFYRTEETPAMPSDVSI